MRAQKRRLESPPGMKTKTSMYTVFLRAAPSKEVQPPIRRKRHENVVSMSIAWPGIFTAMATSDPPSPKAGYW
jgi:hypothetical protein